MQNHDICWRWTWTVFQVNLIKTKVNYKKVQRDLSRVSGKLKVYPIKFCARDKAMPVLKKVFFTLTDAKPITTIQKKSRSSNFHSLLYENISQVFRIVSKGTEKKTEIHHLLQYTSMAPLQYCVQFCTTWSLFKSDRKKVS